MTPQEHYREAERLLLDCQVIPATDLDPATYPAVEDGVNSVGNALAAAQVHATLAQAAREDVIIAELVQILGERGDKPFDEWSWEVAERASARLAELRGEAA